MQPLTMQQIETIRALRSRGAKRSEIASLLGIHEGTVSRFAGTRRIGRPPEPVEDRFWRFVQKTPGCWLWTGSKNKQGYGHIKVCKNGKEANVRAHRLSWVIHCGAITNGLNVLHHCDNPPCIRPDHLFLGTALDNAQDKVQKGRGMRHEQHTSAKLTITQVFEIRRLYQEFGTTQDRLARRYGVSQSLVGAIVREEIWKDHQADK